MISETSVSETSVSETSVSETSVTILMPIYNGVEFIEESVSSVINQTAQNWELLIAINGHPPNSDVYKKVCDYIFPMNDEENQPIRCTSQLH